MGYTGLERSGDPSECVNPYSKRVYSEIVETETKTKGLCKLLYQSSPVWRNIKRSGEVRKVFLSGVNLWDGTSQ